MTRLTAQFVELRIPLGLKGGDRLMVVREAACDLIPQIFTFHDSFEIRVERILAQQLLDHHHRLRGVVGEFSCLGKRDVHQVIRLGDLSHEAHLACLFRRDHPSGETHVGRVPKTDEFGKESG